MNFKEHGTTSNLILGTEFQEKISLYVFCFKTKYVSYNVENRGHPLTQKIC